MEAQRRGREVAGRGGRRVPELLAPAGGPEALLAAVAAGADAVYLGLSAFSARVSAENFSPAQLAACARLAHAHGVRVYAALNTHLRQDELPRALDTARTALAAGADALIVADWGFAALLRRALPAAELHLSTQANVQAAPGLALARALGFARVTTSRELSAAQIAALCASARPGGTGAAGGDAAGAGIDVEVFCHGAICICYAGCCELSARLRGRSANRGACVQPCRFNWELCRGRSPADGEAAGPGAAWEAVASAPGEKLLCPRDYCALGWLPRLARAGVAALKVEGRMKNPDYVYNVVRTYRAALDALRAPNRDGAGFERHGERGDGSVSAHARGRGGGGAFSPQGEEVSGGAAAWAWDDAASACGNGVPALPYDAEALRCQAGLSFNRGFTDAYLAGLPDGRMMSYERAINQGVRVGELVARDHRTVTVRLERPVSAGDVLEIRFYPDAGAKVHGPKRWPMVEVPHDAAAGAELSLYVKRRVDPPCAVYCVRSARVLAETEAAVAPLRAELARYERDAAVGHGGLARGESSAGAAYGRLARGEKDGAAGHPAACAAVPAGVACDAARVPSFAGVLVMRDAADAGAASGAAGLRLPGRGAGRMGASPMLARGGRAGAERAQEDGGGRAEGALTPARAVPAAAAPAPGFSLCVLARTAEEARAALAAGAAVYAEAWRMADDVPAWEPLRGRLAVMLDETLRPGEEDAVRALIAQAGRAVCRNLSQVALAREMRVPFEVMAPLVARNAEAVRLFGGWGAQAVWLPREMREDEVRALLGALGGDGAPAPSVGVVATRAAQVMVCAHCLLQAEGPCDRACASCARRTVPHALRGAAGGLLRIETDRRGTSRLFAAAPEQPGQ